MGIVLLERTVSCQTNTSDKLIDHSFITAAHQSSLGLFQNNYPQISLLSSGSQYPIIQLQYS